MQCLGRKQRQGETRRDESRTGAMVVYKQRHAGVFQFILRQICLRS